MSIVLAEPPVAMTGAAIALTPRQQEIADQVLVAAGRHVGQIALRIDCGFGRTTILRSIHQSQSQGASALVEIDRLMKSLMSSRPMPIEESFLDVCLDALARTSSLLLIDDLHLLMRVADSCNYPRENLLDLALCSLMNAAAARGVCVVFGLEDNIPLSLTTRAHRLRLRSLNACDYQSLCESYLGRCDAVEYERIHHFAPKLNGSQLRNACLWLRGEARATLDTDRFVDHLQKQNLVSNVEIHEVERVDWSDLKGLDELVLELEAKIALPLENAELATSLKLKPKRGVLLAGPPGTGKTTIGKALAHRLKSKFFLLDGTMVADGGDFYEKADALFEAAKNNAPSILFIDDADVIFENSGNRGFYRYMLTLLDGLEGGGTSARVCVMMTAMDPSTLPAALLRSGRIELWLETKLPDEDARRSIITAQLEGLPDKLASCVDVLRIARATRSFTGADLKSMVEDGKLLYAFDEANGCVRLSVESYFLAAAARIRSKRRYGASRFGYRSE
jgi:transitional endoplasmic reticulum ATPase